LSISSLEKLMRTIACYFSEMPIDRSIEEHDAGADADGVVSGLTSSW
jgi:hypothetical protein